MFFFFFLCEKYERFRSGVFAIQKKEEEEEDVYDLRDGGERRPKAEERENVRR